ncbi:beta-glucoside-specific PTS transporter subunit IIABC [Rosenbergiella nectarea]|uniref:beta-glucoside-specific PTS transporter subunit IIABC n=1 Tax=Rosenbergiella nectarea TaxID=988801 RepID=UPI001BD93422|nr:beta-glucoside-specific PTS transporter subunit IIABC [Rosenbergiella nectarea]MBT0731424.1 PTS transporter subunit EIIC [Rosenbergiella nectarea subsp. apis]
MDKIRDYNQLARNILEEVGGKDNIVKFTRCATRLRLVLKDTPVQAEERVKSLPGVIMVVLKGGQFQIVIGTHVAEVFDAFSTLVDESQLSENKGRVNLLNEAIASMSAIFAPIVFVLAAAGILQGLLIVIHYFFSTLSQTGTFAVLNFMSWTPFVFLPVLIAITASRHFRCNIYISVLCCCALINPEWAIIAGQIAKGDTVTFLGIPLAKTIYTSSVLPPIFMIWIMSYVERYAKKIIPEMVTEIFTPFICLVIMVPLTLLIIGPITSSAASGIADGYNWLFNSFPALAAALIGGVWQIIVIFGVHWGITPVIMSNFESFGRDSFQAFQTIAVVAQMSAAMAVAIRTRNRTFKTTAWSAGITGIFGITEPALYGVTLRLKKPFICGCVGGAVGATVTSFFGSYYYAYAGLPSLLTIVNAINPANPMSFIGEVIGVGTAIIITMLLVYFVGFDDLHPDDPSRPLSYPDILDNNESSPQNLNQLTLLCPVSGQSLPLNQVNDPSFSQKLLGEGIAIKPSDNVIYAPCNASVTSIVESQHAVGLTSEQGVEILIHVGLDTVELAGKHFMTLVQQNELVKVGQALIRFDKESIEAAGYDTTTPIVIVNSDECSVRILDLPVDMTYGQPIIHVLINEDDK